MNLVTVVDQTSKVGNVHRVNTEPTIEQAYSVCRSVTKKHAKTFYAASHFIPASKRDACYAVYAFCRYVDDLIDVAMERGELSREDAVALVEHWRSDVAALYDETASPNSTDPAYRDRADVLRAWEHTLQQYHIPRHLPNELIEGVLMDTTITRFATFDDLKVYCYKVASVVGLMTSEIFGYNSTKALEHAIDLGIAMQLTNIIRDVKEDADRGRIYLAQEDLALYGVSEQDILDHRMTPQLLSLLVEYIRRADEFYTSADTGIAMLDADSRITVILMSRNYQKILRRVEAMNYNVFAGRASTSTFTKLLAVPSAYIESKRLSH